MSQKKWADDALQSFDAVVASIPGFRQREGQRKMAAQVAQTLSLAQLARWKRVLLNHKKPLP